MKITNKHKVADIFLRALSFDDYTRGNAKYSNSNLIAPPKSVVIARAHEAEQVSDVVDNFARFRGHAIHASLERFAKPNSIAEERLEAEVDGILISTKPDHYDGDTCELDDYKTTSVWSFALGLKPEWVQQLNVGAWFLRQYGFEVKKLNIHAALWDWNKNEAIRQDGGNLVSGLKPSNYPQSPLHTVEVALWTEEEQLSFIKKRLYVLEACADELARDGDVTRRCTPEERWETQTKFAVMKKGNKKATKLCDTAGMAQAFIEGHKDGGKMEAVERPGEPKRCALGYCNASPWCKQWQKERAG